VEPKQQMVVIANMSLSHKTSPDVKNDAKKPEPRLVQDQQAALKDGENEEKRWCKIAQLH
jgi:hypothetical protein